jgi:hypothetical protein
MRRHQCTYQPRKLSAIPSSSESMVLHTSKLVLTPDVPVVSQLVLDNLLKLRNRSVGASKEITVQRQCLY